MAALPSVGVVVVPGSGQRLFEHPVVAFDHAESRIGRLGVLVVALGHDLNRRGLV